MKYLLNEHIWQVLSNARSALDSLFAYGAMFIYLWHAWR
jgi:hypothetical protein